MSAPVRNRIKAHVRVKARDLVPHELNARVHPEVQKQALRALYGEVGFARSLLAYELPDGRLKLIDGHLRRDLDPNMEVDVEVLDVNDAEARALLLSIDPLAQLAEYDRQTLDQLREITHTDSDLLHNLWQNIQAAGDAVRDALDEASAPAAPTGKGREVPEQYLVLVECESEEQQVELLERFRQEGLSCRALLS
jgi:hypothetical protein